ncbi:hypothetical protein DXG03_008130 [Asterophora parasitica]|uniref:Uncharacterized protein n=1 Tax=Asterophora parasitica TaxID=117018 RepID=A0A9P7K8X2_9AGAR|nr:hypothetical protein DXG03_008130 [Asterophora parasitica]
MATAAELTLPAPPRGSASTRTPVMPHQLQMQADILALLTGDGRPIKTACNACSWLKQKGWILSGESYDHARLVCILFTAAISLPSRHTDTCTNAKSTFIAIALLIEDNIINCISDTLAAAIASKTLHLLEPLSEKLSISAKFASALNTQQAKTTLTLKKASTNLTSISTLLEKLASKITANLLPALFLPSTMAPTPLPTWASIAGTAHPNHLLTCSTPFPSTYDPATSMQQMQIQQYVLCSAHTVLVDINKDKNLASSDRLPGTNNRLWETLNNKLNSLERKLATNGYLTDKSDSTPDPNHKTYICAISSLEHGGYLFKIESATSAHQFRLYANNIDLDLFKTIITACKDLWKL